MKTFRRFAALNFLAALIEDQFEVANAKGHF
jgi:hypothetical protein